MIIAVSTDKLGLKVKPDPSYKTEILLLHHTKEDVARLVDGVNFIPAWHMNKKSWLAASWMDDIQSTLLCRMLIFLIICLQRSTS